MLTCNVLGEVVGSYRVTAKLAEGGMGVVYRAEHQLLGKPAAVKVLLAELSSNREIVNRFFNEARAATAVRHPGIVEIFDFGYLPDGMAFIVMELLDGEPLSRRLASRGRLGEREALTHVRGIASSLAAAHALGIVHRDLKPDNIFLVPDPDMPGGMRPKLLDFGIAKIAEAQRGAASSKTRTGAVLGTPTYMSPEQCKGSGEVDHRSDLYSLGCILYEMVAGRPPFQAEGVGELIGAHLYMQPTPPSQIGAMVSQAAEQLIMQLLQKRPEDRIQTAQELARLLGQGSMPALDQMGAQTMAMAPMRTPHAMLTPVPVATHGGIAGSPTTLSAAVGGGTIVPAARRSRAPLFIALALALGGGAAAIMVMSSKKDAATSAAPAAAGSAGPGSSGAAGGAVAGGSGAGSAGAGAANGGAADPTAGSASGSGSAAGSGAVAVESPDAGVPDAAPIADTTVDAGAEGADTASGRPRDRDRDRDRSSRRTRTTTGNKPGDKPDASSGSGSGKINRGD